MFDWGVLALKVQKAKICSVPLHPAILILIGFTNSSSAFDISVMKCV